MGDSVATSHDWTRIVRTAIRLLLLLVLLGWILLWIMMPTNEFRHNWLPIVRTHTNSTYFGRQGSNLLVCTFPILFIATLGCVYLHLGKGSGDYSQSGKRRQSLWRTPVVLKGTLGIVSATELVFFTMFIALLIWSISTYVQSSFSRIKAQFNEEGGQHLWVTKLKSAALRLGFAGNICCAFLFFPVTRGSSILAVLGLTSEASIRYHIWLGHIAMTLFTAHGLCCSISWAATNDISKMLLLMRWGPLFIIYRHLQSGKLAGPMSQLTTPCDQE